VDEYIIDDSSLIGNPADYIQKDYSIRVGVVRQHVYYSKSQETRYIVEVWKNNRIYPMTCIRSSKFGGLYNYEEFNLRGFEVGESPSSDGNFKVIPGDMVLVAASSGDSREGIIIGSLNHYGRDEILPPNGDIAYISEFNGIQTMINKDGEYRVTFKGIQENIDKLKEPPNGEPYPVAQHNNDVGFSYYQFNKEGSYLLTDNANDELPQSIFVDKPNGKIIVTSGKTMLTINKEEESYEIVNKKTTFNSEEEWNLNTKKTVIKSEDLIDAEATDIKTKGEWVQEGNMEIKGNIKQTGNTDITGNFSTTGTTLLAGGQHQLVYDILLTIGTGNKGAPVISSHILLKTVNTKAT